MSDVERFAGDSIEEIALDGFGWGIGNRMNQSIEAFPVRCQVGENLVDLSVVHNVALENQRAVEFSGEFGDAIQKAFILISKGQLCAFTVASFGGLNNNRMLRQQGR